ncbi:hypothetical protein HY640_02690 [Candidatus Woesearchaeota archaeon]|nr:hypothetical protein [Candidatus Woesearchaeota archaeon]
MARRRKDRKGVELTVNFFVIVALSVVILVFGLKLLYDVLGRAYVQIENLGNCDSKQIDILLADSRVAVCPQKATIGRGASGRMWLGILNTDDNTAFKVELEAGSGVDSAGGRIDGVAFVFNYVSSYTIGRNKDQKVAVVVSVPKEIPRGTYPVSVFVCSGSSTPGSCKNMAPAERYAPVQKFYVAVP